MKPLLELIQNIGIKSVSHITGGGFYENIPRSLPEGCGVRIEIKKLNTPPIFDLLAKAGNIPQHDMFNTYNMGVGMSIIVSPDKADEAVKSLIASGENAYIMGEVTEGEGVELC